MAQARIVHLRQENGRMRQYRLLDDKHTLLTASVEQDAGAYIAHLARMLPRETHKALAALGYYLVGRVSQPGALRKDIITGGPQGTAWAPLSTPQAGGLIDRAKGRRRRRGKGFFGDLMKALAYFRYPFPLMRLDVGWLSASAQRWGYLLQRGGRVPATRKMRRLFSRAGLRLGGKGINLPARPFMAQAMAAHLPEVAPLLESKIARFTQASAAFFAATRANAHGARA